MTKMHIKYYDILHTVGTITFTHHNVTLYATLFVICIPYGILTHDGTAYPATIPPAG